MYMEEIGRPYTCKCRAYFSEEGQERTIDTEPTIIETGCEYNILLFVLIICSEVHLIALYYYTILATANIIS